MFYYCTLYFLAFFIAKPFLPTQYYSTIQYNVFLSVSEEHSTCMDHFKFAFFSLTAQQGESFITIFVQCYQGWEFAHLLLAHLLIRSFRLNQMSDCELFAQIAQDKWATMSDLLRSLRGNERMRYLLKKIFAKNLKSCF